MSRVLVTGASGFLGRPLLGSLLAAGEEVHALGRREPPSGDVAGVRWHAADLLDASATASVVADVRPERLVHLAWYVAHGSFWSAPENVEWVEASLRLLRTFVDCGGSRAVLVGSCAEYAWGGADDLDERSSPLRPATLYGACKDGLRRIAEAYARERDVELAWARLFFLYGPREQPQRLVPAVIRSLLAREPVATTPATQVRDFMHVDDAAAALAALTLSDVCGPVNVASGEGVALAELLDLIERLTGGAELIDRGARPMPPGEPARIVASAERLRDEVGFTPRLGLEQGLASTVAWWREQGR